MPELHATLTDTVHSVAGRHAQGRLGGRLPARGGSGPRRARPSRAGRPRTTACRSTRPSWAAGVLDRRAPAQAPRSTRRSIRVPDGTPRAPQAPQGPRHLPSSGRHPRRRRARPLSRPRARRAPAACRSRARRAALLPGLLDDVAAALPPTPAPPAGLGDAAAASRRTRTWATRPTACRSPAPSTWLRSPRTSACERACGVPPFGTRAAASRSPHAARIPLCNLVTPR